MGEVRDGRVFENTLVLLRTANVLELWSAGARMFVTQPSPDFLRLADGPTPAILDKHRVGWLDPLTGTVDWGPPTCAAAESAWVSEGRFVIGCADSEVWVGERGHPPIRHPTPGSPSAVAWDDGLLVGTFQGDLSTLHDGDWHTSPTGVGAPVDLVTLPSGFVAIRGERGRVRLWSSAARAFVGTLPGQHTATLAAQGALVTFSHHRQRWSLPPDLTTTVYDRRSEGGMVYLAASSTGDRVIIGSATGEVVVFDVEHGASTILHDRDPDGTRAGAIVGDRVMFVHNREGVVSVDLSTGERRVLTARVGRQLVGLPSGFVLGSYGNGLYIAGTKGGDFSLPGAPTAITGTEPLWVTDEQGSVLRFDGTLEPQFTLDVPAGDVANCGERLVFSEGSAVVMRTTHGEEVWRWDGPTPLTALDADTEWIGAGDRDGWVTVLTPDGVVVARLAAHQRLVSTLAVRGDVMFTGSWDGTGRRWGLHATVAPIEPTSRAIREAWRLPLEAVLSASGP